MEWHEYFINHRPAAHRYPPEPERYELDDADLLELVTGRSSKQVERMFRPEMED